MINNISSSSNNMSFLLNNLSKEMLTYLEQLSTGSTINRASDNPSGYSQAKLLEKDIIIEERQASNAERATVYVENASSNIDSIVDTMAIMEDLAVQSKSGIISDEERNALNIEFNSMKQMLNNQLADLPSNIYDGTEVAGVSINLQGTGASGGKNTLESLNLNNIDISSIEKATNSLSALNTSSMQMINENIDLGSISKHLGIVKETKENNSLNTKASLGVLADTDYVKTLMEKMNLEIIQQALLKGFSDNGILGQNINSLA